MRHQSSIFKAVSQHCTTTVSSSASTLYHHCIVQCLNTVPPLYCPVPQHCTTIVSSSATTLYHHCIVQCHNTVSPLYCPVLQHCTTIVSSSASTLYHHCIVQCLNTVPPLYCPVPQHCITIVSSSASTLYHHCYCLCSVILYLWGGDNRGFPQYLLPISIMVQRLDYTNTFPPLHCTLKTNYKLVLEKKDLRFQHHRIQNSYFMSGVYMAFSTHPDVM